MYMNMTTSCCEADGVIKLCRSHKRIFEGIETEFRIDNNAQKVQHEERT